MFNLVKYIEARLKLNAYFSELMIIQIKPFSFFAIIFCYSTFAYSQTNTVGVVLNNELSVDGYTLFSPKNNSTVYLIDNCGEMVHYWSTPDTASGSLHLYNNGDLLFTAKDYSTDVFAMPGKMGIVKKYDWAGNLLWSNTFVKENDYCFHHDMEPLPNGNILLTAWDYYTKEEVLARGKNRSGSSLWAEKLIEIQLLPNNVFEVVWEWKVWDHTVQDIDSTLNNYGVVKEHPEKIDLNYYNATNFDWKHYNGISYNKDEDLIAISSPTFNEVYVIDHSTTTAEAASDSGGNFGKGGDILYRWGNPRTYERGGISNQKLFGQHNVQWIADSLPYGGSIMVFNNGRGRPGPSFSSIDIFSPPRDEEGHFIIDSLRAYGPTTLTKIYTYPEDETAMYSQFSSGVQMLPNANVLVCPTSAFYFVEITHDNKIAWKYQTPISKYGILSQGDSITNTETTWRATRLLASHPAFKGRDLSTKGTIEYGTDENNCSLLVNEDFFVCDTCTTKIINTINNNSPIEESLKIYPNPTKHSLTIQLNHLKIYNFKIVDGVGKVVIQNSLKPSYHDNFIEIDIQKLRSGTYFLSFKNHPKSYKFIVY